MRVTYSSSCNCQKKAKIREALRKKLMYRKVQQIAKKAHEEKKQKIYL